MKRLAVVTILLILFFVNSFYLGMLFGTESNVYFYSTDPVVYGNLSEFSLASIPIPAVDENDQGVTTTLTVQAIEGTGKILVNIDRIFFWGDTQDSIRTAYTVAENVLGQNLSTLDLVYTVTANASVIEGPSAGAAITIATIAAVENRSINTDVTITGKIEQDGEITQVGGILAKAQACKELGISTFLVPPGQTQEVVDDLKCEWYGLVEHCSVVYKTIDVAEETGLNIIEVNNINEALNYFIS